MSTPQLKEILPMMPGALTDVRYGTTNNITGEILYPPNFKLQLQPEAADQLAYAAKLFLAKGFNIVIFDASRPIDAHRKLLLANGGADNFVLDEDASNHPKGLAVDLTLADKYGKHLDMGSGFDVMEKISHVGASGLKDFQLMNRILLSGVMAQAGFRQWPYEWWHFDYVGNDKFGNLNRSES